MSREFHYAPKAPRPAAARYKLRVVQHDEPKKLELHPEIERETRLREVVRKLAALAAGVMVLGITFAICAALAALFKK